MILWQAHLDDDEVPLDPELFVASQPMTSEVADPWLDLVGEGPKAAYQRRVHQIIHMLRAELRRELRFAGRLVKKGRSLRDVLLAPNPQLSPLGRYIAARRASRSDLAEKLESEALAQHRVCPLYRFASLAFVSADQYPVEPARPKSQIALGPIPRPLTASLN